MSQVTIQGNPAGTGVFTVQSPNSNTNRTLIMPDASGQLVLDSAAQVLTNKTLQGGALTLGTAKAFNWNGSSTNTFLDFTGIPSWVKRITVMYSGVSTSGTSIIQVQLGTSGGFVTTGYVSSYTQGASAGSITSGVPMCPFPIAAGTNSGNVTLVNVSGNIWTGTTTNAVSTPAANTSAGTVTLSGVLDRVRITTVNGTDTFDAGTVNIMYEG